MQYTAQFKNNQNHTIDVLINCPHASGNNVELTLAEDAVVILQESSGLFSPIKAKSCTINIMTDSALFNLYTIDPQEILVTVRDLSLGKVLFIGYATPCQYGQDWTSIDTLSLECVDMLSTLKAIPYTTYNYGRRDYVEADRLIAYMISRTLGDSYDQMYHGMTFYWPAYNYNIANGYTFTYASGNARPMSTTDFLHAIKLNDANFFDDDDEETPWSCYDVLEEICKFFNVTVMQENGKFYFLDYAYIGSTMNGVAFWEYTLDLDVSETPISNSKYISIHKGDYAGGTTTFGTDDVYNVISVSANRYDIDELVYDVMEDKGHISITKEKNFGNDNSVWTITQTSSNWAGGSTVLNSAYVYKQYCRLKESTGWTHKWYSFKTLNELNDYYDTNMSTAHYAVLPENKYLNTMGACILHYAAFDAASQKPTKLDWKDVIMFNCLNWKIFNRGISTSTVSYLLGSDLSVTQNGEQVITPLEKPVLEYTSPYTISFSPEEGTSWVVINGALWYQCNYPREWTHEQFPDEVPIARNDKELMFPIEDVTDFSPYTANIGWFVDNIGPSGDGMWFMGNWNKTASEANTHGWGHELMAIKVQIGDKYWNGTAWTTIETPFYLRFSTNHKVSDIEYADSMVYLKWLNIVTNTNYTDQVGAEGYAIPISPEDGVSGQLKITLYTPRQIPLHWAWKNTTQYTNNNMLNYQYSWADFAPVVYMKDFKVDYIYTGTSEWWLAHDQDTDDIKYYNATEDKFKYEKNEELKINSWQENRPIAKSFPIVSFTSDGTQGPKAGVVVNEYLSTINDPMNGASTGRPQEENIINRQLRHYAEPRKKVTIHTHNLFAPWNNAQFDSSAQISGNYVINKQDYDVRAGVTTIELDEFGDRQIH